MGKQGTARSRLSGSSYLIAGLAGGALALAPAAFASEAVVPGALPPLRESVSAVQSAIADLATAQAAERQATVVSGVLGEQLLLAEDPADAPASGEIYPDFFSEVVTPAPPPLKLALTLSAPLPGGLQPRWLEATEPMLPLRASFDLASPLLAPAELGDTEPLPPADPPLKLAQMLVMPPPGGSQPRWMTTPTPTTRLRPSRELSPQLPGAAGIGRPDRQPAPLPDPAAAMPLAEGEVDGEQPVAAVTPVPAASTTPGAGAAPDTSGLLGWEIPPIRWGGQLGYSYQRSSTNTGSSSASHGMFGNLSAASYIYAPWFARVSGRLGLTRSTSNSSSEGGDQSNSNVNVVGGGEVNMFSSSRFPFRVYYDRADTRASGTIVSNDYISNSFGFNQNFRSEDGMKNGNLMFDRNVVDSSDGQRDAVSSLSGSYSAQVGIVQNNLNGRYSLGERSTTGDRARLIGLNSSHIANISDTLNLGATANYSDTDIRTASGFGEAVSSRGRFLQLYGYGSWLPDFEDLDDLPLTINGGIRYSAQDTQFGGEAFRAQTLGINGGALYRHNRNLSLSANGAVNRLTQSSGESQVLTQLGSSVNYVGDPLTFGNFSYNWNTGLDLNWQSAAAETPSNTLVGGQFNHSLSRIYSVFGGQSLSLAATQTVNANNSQLVGSTQSLSHSLSANLSLGGGDRFSGSASAMLSDVRTSGFLEQEYRVVNLGFFGQGQLSQVSNLNLNMMFNWSDQTFQTVDAFGFPVNQNTERMTVNGSAAYSHLRFAGVRGLRYNLIFAADTRLRDERLFGNVNGDVDRARFSLTNRLEYRIGLLDFRLSLINNEVGGKKNALLFFQVSRQIGSY